MRRKVFVVGNPSSGRKRVSNILEKVEAKLNENDIAVDFHLTEVEQNASKVVESKLNAEYTDLLIVGGDGTINEAINGLQFKIPVSIFPAGTGNDFVKMIDIGQSIDDYIQTLIAGPIHSIDLGVCNGRKFVNGVGVGFDGQIVEDMLHRNIPILQGHLKYYYHVLSILASYRFRIFNLSVDNKKVKKNLILLTVANGSTFGGGFKLTPHASLTSGKLALCTVGNISPIKRFLNISKLKTGVHNRLEEVEFLDCTSLEIGANNLLKSHIDGEVFGSPPFKFSILPSALSIRAKSVL